MSRKQQIELVKKLKKPGSDIVSQLTGESMDVLHMAVGLVGELVELEMARAASDRKNVIEEIGDAFFYLEGMLLAIDGELEMADEAEIRHTFGGDVLDLAKKHAIYNQSLKRDEMLSELAGVWCFLNGMCAAFDVKESDVRKENVNKLNVRYKDGYSDAAAKARADKQEAASA